MKKALIIASVPSMLEQFNRNNIQILQGLGYQVEVAANFEEPGTLNEKRLQEFKQELTENNISYFSIPFSRNPFSKKNWKAYHETKKILTENKYDLIHLHSPIAGVCGRLAAKKENTKVIYTAHGFHFYKGAPLLNWLIYYPIEKYLSKYTDCLITINEEDFQRASKKFHAKRTELVHGVGVDKNKFDIVMTQEAKAELRKELGLKQDDFVMICVGELNKNKNQILAIEAMKEIVKTESKVKLLLVGTGILKETYEKEIQVNGLEQYVKLLGYRKDIPQLLNISNVLLSLSFREGLPVNVMEAMMAGLPLIVTNCRGNRDLVQNEVNGYVIEKKEQLIHRIEDIRNGRKLKAKKIEQYEKKVIEQKMRQIYQTI